MCPGLYTYRLAGSVLAVVLFGAFGAANATAETLGGIWPENLMTYVGGQTANRFVAGDPWAGGMAAPIQDADVSYDDQGCRGTGSLTFPTGAGDAAGRLSGTYYGLNAKLDDPIGATEPSTSLLLGVGLILLSVACKFSAKLKG